MTGAHVMRASSLIGLPVVGIDSGEDLAEVRDVVYHAGEHRLIGFTLNKRGRFAGRLKDVLPADAVAAVGVDAIMVEDELRITDSASPEALESPEDSASVIGVRVMSAAGSVLGKVIGVIIATGSEPTAVGYEVDPTDEEEHASNDRVFVPILTEMAVSDDNLMLPEGATEFIRNDLAGFGTAIAAYRQRSTDWEEQSR